MSYLDWKNHRSMQPWNDFRDTPPFWAVAVGQCKRYATRPDGLEFVTVCTAGVSADYFDGLAQLIVTTGPVFHVHAVRATAGALGDKAEQYPAVPLASHDFGPDPSQDEVIRWVRVFVELGGLQAAKRSERGWWRLGGDI